MHTDDIYPVIEGTEDDLIQMSAQTVDLQEETAETRDAEMWLDSMFNEEHGREWLPDTTEPSPLTSAATTGRVAAGTTYKGCKCPDLQHIYDTWPMSDAELTIAKCMTVCLYCGVDYGRPPTLRMHLRSARHAQNNISVVRETRGRGSSITPSWIRIPRAEAIQLSQTPGRGSITDRVIVASRQ